MIVCEVDQTTTVSRYCVVELLGASGMGVIHRAEGVRLKRMVALTFLPIEATPDAHHTTTYGRSYAIIRHMKRTTIFIDPQIERELQALARRRRRPTAALVREAVAQYLVAARGAEPPRFRFIGAGRSGRCDIADTHEDLLFEQELRLPPRSSRKRPAASRPSAGRQRRSV